MANGDGKQALVPDREKRFKIQEYEADYTGGAKKERCLAAMPALRLRLDELQNLLFADKRFGLLIVLQGIDTAGKDGTVKSVFKEVGPLGCSVVNFGVPSEEEQGHDYLWRYHLKAPERGRLVIFNRSHYESVLVERVRGLAPEAVWQKRYDEINAWEGFLGSQNIVVMKFFLHISNEEQRERLQERVDNPTKQWKFRAGDLDDRKLWPDYMAAYGDVVDRCNAKEAPWHVVPADHKWYRDVVIAEALISRLEKLGLRYPEPAPGIVGTTVV